MLAENVADVGNGPGAVVSHELDDDRDPARAVSLEGSFFVFDPVKIPGALFYGPFNGVFGHVFALRLIHGGAQAGVGCRVTAADFGRHGDLLDQLGEYFAAFGVLGAFAMFNIGPLTVSCHLSILLTYYSGFTGDAKPCNASMKKQGQTRDFPVIPPPVNSKSRPLGPALERRLRSGINGPGGWTGRGEFPVGP